MAEGADLFHAVMAELSAYRASGRLPDRDLVTDAFIQETIRLRRLQARAGASGGSEELGPRLAEAERRVRILRSLRGRVLGASADADYGQALEALKTMQARDMVRDEDLGRLGDAATGGQRR